MEAQEVFDTVVNFLRKQGKKSLNANGSCRYRGDDGTKCAVGCLIADEDYTPNMESSSIGALIQYSFVPNRVKSLLQMHQKLLYDLQDTHDQMDVGEWEGQFAKIALKYNLIYTPQV